MIDNKVMSEIKAGVKTAVSSIRSEIKALQAQETRLLAAITTPEETVKARAAKAAPKARGKRGVGMLNVLLPFMEGKHSTKAAELIAHLHTHGYPDSKVNSVYATIANELKKPNSRIERVADGEYKVSAAYFARPAAEEAAEVTQ